MYARNIASGREYRPLLVFITNFLSASYTALITGLTLGEFAIAIRAFSEDASAQPPLLLHGVAGPGSLSRFFLQFSPAPGATLAAARVATIHSATVDISNSLQLGLINDQGVATSLLQKLEAAADAASRGQEQARVKVLNAVKKEINAQSGKHITGIAIQVLLQDAHSLLSK